MIQNKQAFFMIEIIISVIIIIGVVVTQFKVKDNIILLDTKILNNNIRNSLLYIFIPYLKENENKSLTLDELYELKNKKIKEKSNGFKSKNIVLNDLNDLKDSIKGFNIDKFNFLPKKIIVSQENYKKIFYSFSSR